MILSSLVSSANGLMSASDKVLINTLNSEMTSLKSTVVSGKTSIANAIDSKAGTSLTNQSSFNDMTNAINGIAGLVTATTTKTFNRESPLGTSAFTTYIYE